jgi:2-methylcitrate dehydratase
VELFHTDSVICGLSALALRCNAPTVLKEEALEYALPEGKQCLGATPFGSAVRVAPEKAIVANASAVREWDSNGTVFGFNDKLGKDHTAGEFGHNDFYPVVIAGMSTSARGSDL